MSEWPPRITWPPRTFADHVHNAESWLERGYGDRLSEKECKAIVRVLWTRAENALPSRQRTEES